MRHLARLVCGLCFALLAQAQPYLNLDFEISTRGRLWSWSTGSTIYSYSLDAEQVQSGHQSLRIRYQSGATNTLGLASQTLPLELVRGRRVRYSGWIKTDSVNAGYAALWLRVDSTAGVITNDNMSTFAPRGTTGWTRYEFVRDVSPEAATVYLGMFLAGDGTAWFDGLQVEVDGAPIRQGPEPYVGEPAPEQLDWLRKTAIPFRGPDAGQGFDDLKGLKELIGNARIVGLGEGTHGTSEFFRMKHRITEYLAGELGFAIFAIEANMPEAYRVNEYVLTGRGDPTALIKGMYFWTWSTQEVLDMVLWMRRFNQSGKGIILFTGFDMQTASVAIDIVRAFVDRADPGYLSTVERAYALVREAAALTPFGAAQFRARYDASALAAREVREYLEARASGYAERFDRAEVDWVVQNARVVEQAAFSPVGGGLHRDEQMALNFGWIVDQAPPGTRLVIWAHNYHVSRQPGAMGWHLARRYGADYVVLGFAFHEGAYTAVGDRGLATYAASPSFPGSFEYVFHQSGMPQFIIDLRKASPKDPASAWLLGEMQFRGGIGAVANDGFYVDRTLAQEFDALIFFDRSTPSVLLR